MKEYARIDHGHVVELIATDRDITQMFHPDLVWIDISSAQLQPQCGWSYADGVFAPPPEVPISDIKRDAWDEIKGERDRRTEGGGYKVPVDGVDKWFHSDQKSRSQQLGLVLLGAAIPAGLQWKTMDGSFVAMTPALAQQILAAAAASDTAIFAVAEAHRAEMAASADPGTYDYTGGWPQTYAEWVAAQQV